MRLTDEGAVARAIAVVLDGAETDEATLAADLRERFGDDVLRAGTDPQTDDLLAAWAIEAQAPQGDEPTRVVSVSGDRFDVPLRRLGDTDLLVGAHRFEQETVAEWAFQTGAKQGRSEQLELYHPDPATIFDASVPHGTLTQQPRWESSAYPGTTRDWWIYVPAQYRQGEPANTLVCMDGKPYSEFLPVALDNLIAAGTIPVTVAIFIQPGEYRDGLMRCRQLEYDSVSDRFSRLVIDELLPRAAKEVDLADDPGRRAIAGMSSGGIAAFTVAWRHPDVFSKVMSWCGSFSSLGDYVYEFEQPPQPGADAEVLRQYYRTLSEDRESLTREPLTSGQDYPTVVRRNPGKPLRIYLQSGDNDMETVYGCWAIANKAMASALEFSGYDYRFDFGRGFHSTLHGRSLLTETMRWLWA